MADLVTLGPWDIALIVGVSAQATVLAYVYSPRLKALAFTLPIPFTIANLALGRPVDATNVLGLLLLVAFTHAVRLLHTRARVPIIAAIILSAVAYCLLGAALVPIVRRDAPSFWAALIGVTALAVALLRLMPLREEQGYRSPLSPWIKAPIIVAVVLALVILKQSLQGFMTLFPMVGVVAAYECRRCLWTISRQVFIIVLCFAPMIATMRLLQPHTSLPAALAAGWVPFLIALMLLQRCVAGRDRAAAAAA